MRFWRVPRRTLRAQLALLYAAVFGLACAVVVAFGVIFKPDFLIGTGCQAAPGSATGSGRCGQGDGLSFTGTITHDAAQNWAGIVTVVVLAAAAVAVGWVIAGRVLRPLRTITATARDISDSNLSQRLALAGPDDEFRQLGQTLDGLFGRLEASFEAQRHFVANASHELRTPLTAEKTVLQVALADPSAGPAELRAACEKALAWTGQQERLIDGLLTLASSERGIESRERFDLGELAREAVQGCQGEAERRGILFDSVLTPAPATGDPALVRSLIANLVGNAVRHNVDGGRVEVRTGVADGDSEVTVRNTGALVPDGEVERLFEPFRRMGGERVRHGGVNGGATGGGHGLGLAIVAAIAGVHGATVRAAALGEGGLEVTVRFP